MENDYGKKKVDMDSVIFWDSEQIREYIYFTMSVILRFVFIFCVCLHDFG